MNGRENVGDTVQRRGRGGFTLIEVMVIVLIIGVLSAIAAPPVAQIRESARLQNGRHMVTSALSLARATGPRWGRVAVLRIDTVLDAMWVVVDTGDVSRSDTLVARTFRFADDLGVELESNRSALCFNARGIGTTGVECPATGGRILVTTGGRADTLELTSVGRVR